MSLNLSGFIKSLLPSFSKSDLESDMETSLETIQVITTVYADYETIYKIAKPKDKLVIALIKEFYKEINKYKSNIKLSTNSNFPADIINLFKNIQVNGKYVSDEISDSINDVIVSQALTAYKANILRTVPHFFFITKYALDFLNFIYVQESINASEEEFEKSFKLNKKQQELIEKNMWIFARLMVVYGDNHDKFKSILSNLEEITIPKENIDEVLSAYSDTKLDIFSTLPSGFIGSPIYSVRLIFTQWAADRHRYLTDKKRLLMLRHAHLKLLQEQGQGDLNTEKEIMYLQNHIVTIDKKLYDIEKDLD